MNKPSAAQRHRANCKSLQRLENRRRDPKKVPFRYGIWADGTRFFVAHQKTGMVHFHA